MNESNTNDIPRVDRESLIKERLPLAGARVIDVGCGEGWFTQLVAPKTDKVIGIDPSATAIGRARAVTNSSNATYLLASADSLPVEDSWADIVVYYNSLHHVPADLQSKAIAETARVLVPGGILCIVEPMTSGSAYELFRAVEDESAVYASTYKLVLETGNGAEFQQELEEHFVDFFNYQDFEQFLDHVLIVDDRRAAVLPEFTDLLHQRFEQLGEAVDDGRRYDQAHRLSLLQRL